MILAMILSENPMFGQMAFTFCFVRIYRRCNHSYMHLGERVHSSQACHLADLKQSFQWFRVHRPRQNFFTRCCGKFKSCGADSKAASKNNTNTLTHTTIMAMKRKLNSDDVPEVVAPEAGEAKSATPAKATFDSLNLDARILQAITREKFTEPTPVQAATLPLALSGKDILGTSGEHEW
jgi:hypothetical protein